MAVTAMNRIQVSARFANVSSATLTEFKEAAAEAMDIAKGEPGVLQYDWFFNDNQTVCVVRETYRDSDALLAHIANVGHAFARLVELGGGCELEMFGDRPAQLGDARAGLRHSVFPTYFQGK